jgi:hypothetical protein
MKKLLLLAALASLSVFLLIKPYPAKAQLAQPAQAGQFYIFGVAYTGDGLAPGWKNGSLFNGVNTWNIIDTQQFYAGTHSVSWSPSAPFERGWLVGQSPINLSQYQFLYFYGRSTEIGQRFEIGFSDQNGNTIGQMVPLENAGPPLAPDRWALYNIPLTQFAAGTGQVYGIVLQDMNGAPQKKAYFDEIILSTTAGTQPIVSQGLGQPATPMPTEKPVGPYNPQISPWVFIIPGIIIILAIFFE